MTKKLGLLFFLAVFIDAGESKVKLDDVKIDRYDLAAQQRGAALFFNYCSSCHSLKFTRYDALGQDLKILDGHGQLNKDAIEEYFHPSKGDIKSPIIPALDKDSMMLWYGKLPPDLTLVSRVRGKNWLYTYMRTFYKDEARPFGVNNLVYPNVGMPHVLVGLQGLNLPVKDHEGHVVGIQPDPQIPLAQQEAYDQHIKDLVHFFDLVGEPNQEKRHRLGVYVMLFLLVFTVFSYLFYKETWKGIKD